MGGFGGVDAFKKDETAKTLKNALCMIETNPLNHNWSHFAIFSGLTLHQFKKKTAVKCMFVVYKLKVGDSLVLGAI